MAIIADMMCCSTRMVHCLRELKDQIRLLELILVRVFGHTSLSSEELYVHFCHIYD